MRSWLSESMNSYGLMFSSRAGIASTPDESERDFRIRLQQAMREGRDAALARVREKYTARIRTAEDRLRRAQQAVERETEQASESKMSAAVTFGTSVLGALLGRKTISATNIESLLMEAKRRDAEIIPDEPEEAEEE